MPTTVTSKPTANTTGGTTAPTNMANAYDLSVNDTTTYAQCLAVATTAAKSSVLTVKTIPTMGAQTWNSKKIKYNFSIPTYVDNGNGANASVQLSLDGGSTFTSGTNNYFALQSSTIQDSFTVPTSQDDTLIQVKFSATAGSDSGSGDSIQMNVYDVWLEGIYGMSSGGKKAIGASAS
jgi:hypothetical protein